MPHDRSGKDWQQGQRSLNRWLRYRTEPGRYSAPSWSAVALSSIALIAWLDFHSGPEIHLFVFYLLPILIATWHIGWRAGMTICVICILASLIAVWHEGRGLGHDAVVTASARLLVFSLAVFGWGRLHDMSRALAELSLIDPLTELQNRRACLLRGDAELARIRRNGGCLSLMFLDLDNFKGVNDNQGHKAGDRLLRATATELLRLLRHSDMAARLGGDEFAVILPGTDGAGGRRLAETVHANLAIIFRAQGADVTASIGVATFCRPPDHFEDVLQYADQLMYEIKKTGKDGVMQRDVKIDG